MRFAQAVHLDARMGERRIEDVGLVEAARKAAENLGHQESIAQSTDEAAEFRRRVARELVG